MKGDSAVFFTNKDTCVFLNVTFIGLRGIFKNLLEVCYVLEFFKIVYMTQEFAHRKGDCTA